MRAVRTYLDHLVVERGLAENTLKSYRRDLRRYLGHLDGIGVTELDQVTEETVSGFLMALREGERDHPPLSATSAGRTVVAVRGLPQVRGQGRAGGRRPLGRRTAADAGQAAAQGGLARRRRAMLEAAGARRHGAGAARPGAAGGALRHRRPDLRGGRARRRRPRPAGDPATCAPCCCAARAARSGSCRSAPTRGRRSQAYVVRGPAGAGLALGEGTPRPVPQRPRRAALAAERLDGDGQAADRAGMTRRGLAAHAAALVRHPPARGRRRRPGRAGAARPRLGDHHADLHAGDRRQPARGVRRRPSARSGLTSQWSPRGRAAGPDGRPPPCTGSSTGAGLVVHPRRGATHIVSPDFR